MKVLVFIWLVILSPCFALAEIDVTDSKGRTMKVEVLAYTASSGNTRIKRMSDGTIFNVKISMFNPASQEKIIEVAPKAKARLRTKVSVGKRRQQVGDSSYMERQTITGKITIENESRDVDFVKGKATILLVARQTKRYANNDEDYGKILHKEEFGASIRPGQSSKFECRPVETEYDSDKDSSNIGGWQYYGWLLIIQEEDGSVHSVETSIGSIKKEAEVNPRVGEIYLGLQVGKLVEKNLTRKR